jgi:hypothetical protein
MRPKEDLSTPLKVPLRETSSVGMPTAVARLACASGMEGDKFFQVRNVGRAPEARARPWNGSLEASLGVSHLAALLRGIRGAQDKDMGWLYFNGVYSMSPIPNSGGNDERIGMYHTHVRDELVCRTLREKCQAKNAKEGAGGQHGRPGRGVGDARHWVLQVGSERPEESTCSRD